MTQTLQILHEKQADLLARYLPDGKAWEAKWIEDSNLRKLLIAVGEEFENIEQQNEWLRRELNLYTTHDLIDYWEEHYGIPDTVFTVENKTVEQRRRQILIKDLMEGADRTENWEKIASLFGFNCKVYPARDVARFTYKFPIRFFENAKYTICVDLYGIQRPSEFPLQFTVKFGSSDITLLKRVFEIIRPADCVIIYYYR